MNFPNVILSERNRTQKSLHNESVHSKFKSALLEVRTGAVLGGMVMTGRGHEGGSLGANDVPFLHLLLCPRAGVLGG